MRPTRTINSPPRITGTRTRRTTRPTWSSSSKHLPTVKSDSDSDRLRPGCHRSDTTVDSALFISLKVSPSSTSFGQPRIRTIRCRRRNPRAPEARGSIASDLSLALVYSAAQCALQVSPNSVSSSRVSPTKLTTRDMQKLGGVNSSLAKPVTW